MPSTESAKSVIRVVRREKFLTVENETVRDDSISFRATGLLMYLLSMREDWKISQQDICTKKREGRDAMLTAWRELQDARYLYKSVERDLSGRITQIVWTVYEVPSHHSTEKPKTAEPKTAEPISADPTLRKNKEKNDPKGNKARCTLKEVRAFAVSLGCPESDGDSMLDHWEANGWKVGRNPMKDWQATFRYWHRNFYLPSQQSNRNGHRKVRPSTSPGNAGTANQAAAGDYA